MKRSPSDLRWWYYWALAHAQLSRRAGDRLEAAWALTLAGQARRLLAASLVVVAACCNPTGPAPREYGAVAIPTTAQYRRLWADLERCSGLRGNLDAVQFYAVDSLNNSAVGRTFTDGPRVYLVSLFASDSLVVSHEMMHALLQRTGHPAHYFNGVCGDLFPAGETGS